MKTINQQSRFLHNVNYFTLCSTPTEESCTQVNGNYNDAQIEIQAFKQQLIRLHGQPPKGAEFFILENYHDLGTYYELAIMYQEVTDDQILQDLDSDSEIYASNCESLPDFWDKEAKEHLKKLGHSKWQDAKIIKMVA